MASFVWGRDPEEAYVNPYEYDAQKQFVTEARSVLDAYHAELVSRRFTGADKSLDKALWMLFLDSLDALRDCLDCIEAKKHRLAGRLFRDAMETMDLAEYFASSSDKAKRHLEKWYENEVIEHSIAREALKLLRGEVAFENRRQRHRELSKFTHRTYRALLKSYSLGANDWAVYDGLRGTTDLVLPHTIAAYMAILADRILDFMERITRSGVIDQNINGDIWAKCLKEETVPRRFEPHTYKAAINTG